MEKPPVNPVNKVELPKTEQPLEHFSFSEQEKNIHEVFKLSPELENIAVEATKSGETISLYRIENKNIEKKPDGITSHKDLKGQWFTPDLETALVYLRKTQQTFGAKAKRAEGANLVVVKIPKEEFENLHVSKHPITSQMDVENDNYIVPENIERNYINLDDVQDKVGNFENLQKAREQIKKKMKDFEQKEAVKLYAKYLETIFPESKVRDIVYHRTGEKFDVFDKSKVKKTNANRFYFSPINTGRYGGHVMQAILNIKNLAIPYDNNFINDVNIKHPEYTKGKSEYFHLPAQIYVNADKYGYDGVYAFEGTNDDEYSVYHSEQIHILGSKQDIEGFKKFVSGHSKAKP